MKKALFIFLTLCAYSLFVSAQTEDGRNVSLDSIVVTARRVTIPIKIVTGKTMSWDMNMMSEMPKILGNADPIHYAQMLPGIQTNAEYQSGINIQGCENSHNYISVSGVPIYNINHLLGFFSTFNASHFPSMSLQKTATTAAAPNRMGGELTMELPSKIPEHVSGEASVGMMSSQGTVRMPIRNKTLITLSLRASYLNLLYSRWLKAGENQIRYSFYDANATLLHQINSRNTLIVDFYNGMDYAKMGDSNYLADLSARWGNNMQALHWIHKSPNHFTMKHTLYHTQYINRFALNFETLKAKLPSSINDFGYRGSLNWKRLTSGIDFAYHDIHPQEPDIEGYLNTTTESNDARKSIEMSIYVDYKQPVSDEISFSAGLRGNLYSVMHNASYLSADPSVTFLYNKNTWQITANYSMRHQYLFQTGFSSMGLPTEFWLSCDKNLKPQYTHSFSLSSGVYMFGRRYRLSVDLYYKKLYNQIEYNGTVLDFVNTVYDLQKVLLHGKGENYGANLMFSKSTGSLTGWISYSYTRAQRTFTDVGFNNTYPANHERPHEINCVATYALGNHWSFGGTFVYASGTPFTAPLYFYLLNDNIISQFSEHNSHRLKPYCRLDLSINYKWQGRICRESGVNLSLYNALSHHNDLFHYLKVRSDGSFSYRPVTFVMDILPSISYYCKF